MDIEELQKQVKALTDDLDKSNSEAAFHRKSKAEEKKAREELEAKLAEIEKKANDAENEKLKKSNDIEAILKRKDNELAEAKKKLEESATKWKSMYEKSKIDDALIVAASKKNAFDPNEIASLLRQSVALDEQGNVFIKSGDGVAVNDKGDRISVEDYVSKWLDDKPHHVKPLGGGNGSNGGRKSNSANTLSRSSFDSMNALGRSKFIREGGQVVDA